MDNTTTFEKDIAAFLQLEQDIAATIVNDVQQIEQATQAVAKSEAALIAKEEQEIVKAIQAMEKAEEGIIRKMAGTKEREPKRSVASANDGTVATKNNGDGGTVATKNNGDGSPTGGDCDHSAEKEYSNLTGQTSTINATNKEIKFSSDSQDAFTVNGFANSLMFNQVSYTTVTLADSLNTVSGQYVNHSTFTASGSFTAVNLDSGSFNTINLNGDVNSAKLSNGSSNAVAVANGDLNTVSVIKEKDDNIAVGNGNFDTLTMKENTDTVASIGAGYGDRIVIKEDNGDAVTIGAGSKDRITVSGTANDIITSSASGTYIIKDGQENTLNLLETNGETKVATYENGDRINMTAASGAEMQLYGANESMKVNAVSSEQAKNIAVKDFTAGDLIAFDGFSSGSSVLKMSVTQLSASSYGIAITDQNDSQAVNLTLFAQSAAAIPNLAVNKGADGTWVINDTANTVGGGAMLTPGSTITLNNQNHIS